MSEKIFPLHEDCGHVDLKFDLYKIPNQSRTIFMRENKESEIINIHITSLTLTKNSQKI